MARRRRNRRRRRGGQPSGLIERIWGYATDVRTPGLLLFLGGLLWATSPWTRTAEPLVVSWWDATLHLPGALGLAAGLSAVAAVLFIGVLWNRFRLATDPSVEESAVADVALDDDAGQASVQESRFPGLAWAGAISMVTGIALVVGFWLVSQQSEGVAQVPIAVGETIDHYTVSYGEESLDVMLPVRLRLSDLGEGEAPTARIQLFQAGQQPGEPRALSAGAGIDVDGFRLTFSGMRPDATKLRAVFGSDAPDTISVTAGEGETFQLGLEGAEYKVLEVSRNYLGAMGPAAKVRAPELGEFWVFQRADQAETSPELDHPVELEQVQTQPAAIFAITRARPFWPISAGATLFVIGFALLVVFPERIVRQTDARTYVWSFNEAGRVAEQTLAHLGRSDGRQDQDATKS